MTAPQPDETSAPVIDLHQVQLLQRRLARERQARVEAERIAEQALRDVYDTLQEMRRSARIAELLGDVAVQANEATNVPEAMARALASVCEYAGWPVGHALVRSEAGRLRSSGAWHCQNSDLIAAFRAASQSREFEVGVGLPGRVMASGRPVWITDLRREDNFPRAEVAAACGLLAGFAIPILIRNETAGVLEFFGTEISPPDESMLRVVGFVGAQLGRVMEREAAEERLIRLALYDGLTGLPNRLLLMDRLSISMARVHRGGGRLGVLYVDVDDFKTINDSRGHDVGDAVLTALAARLHEAVCSVGSTTPTDPWTLARLGGDEFAIVLDDWSDAEPVAQRIEAVLRQPLQLADCEVFVNVSIGTATTTGTDPGNPEDLLAAANVAMHAAKRAGKSRHVAFEPRMHDEARRRHELGDQLHRAVDNGEFELHYQPVVDLSTGTVIGAEALLRWYRPGSGPPVPPETFIGRAEETGLIVPIGAWVLSEACRQAQRWLPGRPGTFTVAVNVSGRQLREPGFLEIVRGVLADTGLPPEALCLEMTESILMERDDEAIAVLAELRRDGVHLAIDDFGTGYSSLGALQRLPVDLLKIDRSFVASLPQDDDAGTIAWAVVRLGHTLGLPVLAEGVETAEQRQTLRRFGCDQAQGFLFGRPQSVTDFTATLAGSP